MNHNATAVCERELESPARIEPGGERFRCSAMVRFPTGQRSELVYSPFSGEAGIIPLENIRLMRACGTFATLEEHAAQICRRYGVAAEKQPAILQRLRAFAAAGYLTSSQAILERCTRRAEPDLVSPIGPVCFVTKDRPAKLLVTLESYIGHTGSCGGSHDFVVMDDTPDAGARQALREALAALGRLRNATVLYAGPDEKQRYLRALAAECGGPADVVAFALSDPFGLGSSIGANRNSLLLDTVGEKIFSADDDTLCHATAVPGATNTLRFGDENDPTHFWFYEDRETALQSNARLPLDVLNAHERLLGRSLPDIVTEFARTGDVNIEDACLHLLQSLQSGCGQVLVTFNGVVGDSGMYSGMGLPLWLPPTRDRLLRSEEDYRTALSIREVLRAASAITVCHGGPSMSTFLGLDNRSLLPPFPPVLRNEDGTFGTLIRACFKDAYFGHLPWALVHDAAPGRTYSPNYISALASARFCDILNGCVATWFRPVGAPDAAGRLRALGEHLIDLGELDRGGFEEQIKLQLWNNLSQHIAVTESALAQSPDAPPYWVADLRTRLEVIHAALQDPDYILPADLREGRAPAETIDLAQTLVRRFGELLRWWPAMVEAARSLRRREVRMAQTVC